MPTAEFLYLLGKWAEHTSIADLSKNFSFTSRSIQKEYAYIRSSIGIYIENNFKPLSGTVQIDTRRINGEAIKYSKECNVFPSKRPVLIGFMDSGKRIYTRVVTNTTKDILHPVIQQCVRGGSELLISGVSGLKGLEKRGYKYKVIPKGKSRGLSIPNYGLCLLDFWNYIQQRLSIVKGVPESCYCEFVKECEFRWNHRDNGHFGLYKQIEQVLLNSKL